jgi:hypothetical protein
VALGALANLGNPESYKLLLKAARMWILNTNPPMLPKHFWFMPDRLAEKGEIKLSQKALKAVMKANQSDDKLHNHAAALSVYAKHFGYETMPMLLKAVDSNNKEFRYAALNMLPKMWEV